MASEAVRWFCQVALPLSSFLPSFPPFLSSHQDFGAIRVSTLTLVDLAGSERIAKTGAEGQRMKEVRNRLGGMAQRSTVGPHVHQLLWHHVHRSWCWR